MHCSKLKERGLSVRGLSLLVNAQILSKLWHLLRVVPVPKFWLNEVRTVVRTFVLPFRPAPSWRSICLHKHLGGLGVIDIHQQHLALQLIYIQRILRPKSIADFVTPSIGHSIYLCTGHRSFLPWLKHPRTMLAFFKQLPTLSILTRLLTELPPLAGHSSWPGRWHADTPLRFALVSVLSPSDANYYDLKQIPLCYTVANAVSWSYPYNQFTNFLRIDIPISNKVGEVLQLLTTDNPPIAWRTSIKKFMPSNFGHDVPPPHMRFQSAAQRSSQIVTLDASHWVPYCTHWKIQVGDKKAIPFLKLTPGILRQYWSQRYLQEKLPGPSSSLGIPQIPYSCPPGFCHPRVWKKFWSLRIPHSVLTCWWRLLRASLSTQLSLHRLRPRLWPTTTCKLCTASVEDDYHFVVGCPMKWSYWLEALNFLSLSAVLRSPADVWHVLLNLKLPSDVFTENYTLELVGNILETLWKYHWSTVISQDAWSIDNAINRLKSSVTLKLTIKEVDRSSQQDTG